MGPLIGSKSSIGGTDVELLKYFFGDLIQRVAFCFATFSKNTDRSNYLLANEGKMLFVQRSIKFIERDLELEVSNFENDP